MAAVVVGESHPGDAGGQTDHNPRPATVVADELGLLGAGGVGHRPDQLARPDSVVALACFARSRGTAVFPKVRMETHSSRWADHPVVSYSPVPPVQSLVWNGEAGRPSMLMRFGVAT